jgi:hypothetical protein
MKFLPFCLQWVSEHSEPSDLFPFDSSKLRPPIYSLAKVEAG